jgi:RNA polymerase sigma-70 factor (ECF subfamily)
MFRTRAMVEKSDAELIPLVVTGDHFAAETLLRRYEVMVFDFLLKTLGKVHDAEDATQETFVKVLRGLPKYTEQGLFKAWVFQIARREGLSMIRRRRWVLLGDVESDDRGSIENQLADRDRDPSQSLAGYEIMASLRRLIERLPVNEKEVFLMRTEFELSFAEIANAMGCPLNTALGRMRNAVIKLRRWIRITET